MLLLAAALLALSAQAQEPPPPSTGIELSAIDRSVLPGNDFFRYANGAWLARTEIPADRSTYGVDEVIDERTRQRTAELIRNAGKDASAGPEARRIFTYYSTYLDAATIEARGLRPLGVRLHELQLVHDRKGLARALGKTLRADVDVLNATNLHTANLFGLWVAQDLSDPHKYAAFVLQGGLSMPDRDYYLNDSQKMADIRAHFRTHIAAMFRLAQLSDPEGRAARVYALEEKIARVHVSRAESEQVLKGNNHWTAAQVAQRAPGLDWRAYFAAAGLDKQGEFVIWQPTALTGISALTASEPLADWQDWLRYHAIERAAPFLPKALLDEHFEFFSHVLSGTPQQEARWKLAVNQTNAALGEAVGKLYVEHYFPPSEKARAEAMTRNLLTAFAARIDRLQWMTPQTRARAKAKLAALRIGVGYPDHWRSFAGLQVANGDALGNAERAALYDYHYRLGQLGAPVDRGEWAMVPQEVNAVNLPAMNALNFPAAILQPPYFDPRRDPLFDYGAIGAVIGHEISHSFDDQGALFDASGRLENWWTPEDFAHFEAAGKRLAAQFDAYHPFPDIHVNGTQTLSENIADVAGLSTAFDAWQLTLKGRAAAAADGFTPEQLFFLSFAQSWQQKIREAALRRRLVTDGHAPAEYRADTVRNLDAWYQAFGAKPGQALYLTPADRVQVW